MATQIKGKAALPAIGRSSAHRGEFDERRAIEGPKTKLIGEQTLAAIVELDIAKLDRQGLILLGMAQVLAKYRALLFRWAEASPDQAYAMALYKAVAAIAEEDNQVQVELTKAATRTNAAKINHLKSDAAR